MYGAIYLMKMSEQRKILSIGDSFAVTLPKQWSRANALKKGDVVSIKIQRDKTLNIIPGYGIHEKMRELHLLIDVNEDGRSIVRSIIAGFLDGYTSIKLTSKKFFSAEQIRAIREITSRLYMMITESEAGRIAIETLLDETKTAVTTSVERMHMITYSMSKDLLSSLRNENLNLVKTVVSFEDDVDNLMFLILRLIRLAAIQPSLANQFGLDPLDCLDIQTLVHRIERIADHVTIIAKSHIWLIENGISIPENLLSIIIRAAEIAFSSYNQSVESFLSKDVSYTNEIIDKESEIEELYMKITPMPYLDDDENKSSSLTQLVLIREGIRKISHYSADIAELTINRTYQS